MPSKLATITGVNVLAAVVSLSSVWYLYVTGGEPGPGVTGIDTPQSSHRPVVSSEALAIQAQLPAPGARSSGDIDLEAMMTEMTHLAGELQSVKAELARLQPPAAPQPPVVRAAAVSRAPMSEQFLLGEGSGRLENVEVAFWDDAVPSVDLLSSDCVGDMCRISYLLDDSDPDAEQRLSLELPEAIASNVRSNVHVVFEKEGGESVMYVKLID